MYFRLCIAVLTFALAADVGLANGGFGSGGFGSGSAGSGGIGPSGGYGGGHKGRNVSYGPNFGVGGLGYGYGLGYWGGIGALYNGLDFYSDYRVPYFSAHPPVYYSYPVPRTYGHSPFAYPPHFSTPEVVLPVEPLTIANPHLKPKQAKVTDETASAPAGPKPLVVMNPFVTPSTIAATER